MVFSRSCRMERIPRGGAPPQTQIARHLRRCRRHGQDVHTEVCGPCCRALFTLHADAAVTMASSGSAAVACRGGTPESVIGMGNRNSGVFTTPGVNRLGASPAAARALHHGVGRRDQPDRPRADGPYGERLRLHVQTAVITTCNQVCCGAGSKSSCFLATFASSPQCWTSAGCCTR